LTRRDSRITLDDAVAAFWLRLAAYPLLRRPRCIALNLVLDTRKDILREQRPLGLLPPPPPLPDTTADLVLAAGRHFGLASPAAWEAAASVYLDGLTSDRAGRRHQVTATAIRHRCQRVVVALRRHRDSLTDLAAPTHPAVFG